MYVCIYLIALDLFDFYLDEFPGSHQTVSSTSYGQTHKAGTKAVHSTTDDDLFNNLRK